MLELLTTFRTPPTFTRTFRNLLKMFSKENSALDERQLGLDRQDEDNEEEETDSGPKEHDEDGDGDDEEGDGSVVIPRVHLRLRPRTTQMNQLPHHRKDRLHLIKVNRTEMCQRKNREHRVEIWCCWRPSSRSS